jgi:hypothetical protein
VTDEILLGAPPATGPLDILGGARAAYGLRRLRQGYTGPLVNIRRSSDNAQRDFYALPNGDLPVASVAGFVGAGAGLATKLYDQTGKGNHVSQATAAQQPSIALAATQRLRPVIACGSASNTFLSGTIPASALPLTLFGVAKRTSRPQFGDFFNLGFNFPTLYFNQGLDNTGGLANISVGGVINTTMADNAFHAMVGVFVNGTDGVVYVDAAAKVSASTLSTAAGSTSINVGGVSGSVLDGLVTEAVYLSNSVTDAQAAALIANARAYYGF